MLCRLFHGQHCSHANDLPRSLAGLTCALRPAALALIASRHSVRPSAVAVCAVKMALPASDRGPHGTYTRWRRARRSQERREGAGWPRRNKNTHTQPWARGQASSTYRTYPSNDGCATHVSVTLYIRLACSVGAGMGSPLERCRDLLRATEPCVSDVASPAAVTRARGAGADVPQTG